MNNQTQNNESQNGIQHCNTVFTVPGGREIVNIYKCNQKQFTASDMWSIQKQKRQVAINSTISINS